MAKHEIRNGQAEYGIVHVQEEEMREAGVGVFEEKSGEVGRKKAKPPTNKMDDAPANKAATKAKAK